MLDSSSAVRNELSAGQLQLIARQTGAFSGKTLIDVGCGNAEWIGTARQRGGNVQGMEERGRTTAAASDVITVGSPAAAVPWESHSVDAVLLRGTALFNAAEFSPELMIGLANLGSSLKAKGKLLIPLSGSDPADVEQQLVRWKNLLSVFPGKFTTRQLSSGGIMSYLTLAFLFGKNHSVNLIEFQVGQPAISRLEWHRLARNAVMERMQSPAVA